MELKNDGKYLMPPIHPRNTTVFPSGQKKEEELIFIS